MNIMLYWKKVGAACMYWDGNPNTQASCTLQRSDDTIRTSSESSLKDFQLTSFNRFANGRRDFGESRAMLEEHREGLQFIAQVLKSGSWGMCWNHLLRHEAAPVSKAK